MNAGALVWLVSGLLLLVYGLLIIIDSSVPGIEEIVELLNSIPPRYIYITAFIAIFFEGLYVIGNFFPGATLVLILAILSQDVSWLTFALTILSIFVGWSFAGVVNILFAQRFLKSAPHSELEIQDKAFATWFPSFRAAYEVAQIAEGGDPRHVLSSALRVRIYASLAVGIYSIGVALLVDINEVSNEEGFWSLLAIAIIMLYVGWLKMDRANDVKN